MSGTVIVAFAIVAFIGIATPGPTVLVALSNGSRFGARRAMAGMCGAVLSDIVLISTAGLGLGTILVNSAALFSAVKWLGVGYLAFLGVVLLLSKGQMKDALNSRMITKDQTAWTLARRSFLVAATNPKGYLFFSAFLPQFVDAARPQVIQYVILGSVFATIDFLVMLGYATLGSRASRLLRSSTPLWIERCCGGTLLALAGGLAFYRVSRV